MKLLTKILAATVLGCVPTLSALDITADYSIQTKGLRRKADHDAVQILNKHLEKIFGKKLISGVTGKNIILSADNTLDEEEWIIKVQGNDLIISGGNPRGLYYGVCEFLEKFAGVRYFTKNDILIPAAEKITVPDGKEFRRKPAFYIQRYIYTDVELGLDHDNFMAFNKSTCPSAAHIKTDLHTAPMIDNCHSFYLYTKLIPKDRPDMLPVDSDGNPLRAVNGVGPGQICFSNKDFRELVKKEVGRKISERKALAKKLGISETSVARGINISQNDNYQFCQCSECKKLYKKYGAVSGALIEFLNDIASAYPDMLFETFAYQYTEEPPKGIVPRDNVLIQFALLGKSNYHYDLLRPLSHPVSYNQRKVYESWRNIVKRKSMWVYHRLYHVTEAFPWPQACFWTMAEDIRFYQQFGAERIFVESEYNRDYYSPRAFHDLHVYLAAKLIDDPSRDDKKLIREFMEHQYGPAAPAMIAYADHLKKTFDSIPGRLCEYPLYSRSYINVEFFREIEKNLAEAERLAAGNDKILKRIAIERIPVDFAMLNLWDSCGSKLYSSRQKICDRLEKNVRIAWDRYQPHPYDKYYNKVGLEFFNKTLAAVKALRQEIPQPKEFRGKKFFQFVAAVHSPMEAKNDPDAILGRAIKLGNLPGNPKNHGKTPMVFGIYDKTTKKIIFNKVLTQKGIAQDEKYHLIRIGKYTMPRKIHRYQMYGHATWRLDLSHLIANLWRPSEAGNTFDVYVSAKLTGPAYVKGSKKENAVFVDRVIFVKR